MCLFVCVCVWYVWVCLYVSVFVHNVYMVPSLLPSDMVVAGKTQDPVIRQSKSLSPGTLSLDQEIQQTTGNQPLLLLVLLVVC